jgi:putative Flp pilus-assembly TadE/G-like protein
VTPARHGCARADPAPQASAPSLAVHAVPCGEEGRVSAFVLITFTALLLTAGLVLDGGNALAAKSRAIGIAEEAARTGGQRLDLAAVRAGRPPALDPMGAAAAWVSASCSRNGGADQAAVPGDDFRPRRGITRHGSRDEKGQDRLLTLGLTRSSGTLTLALLTVALVLGALGDHHGVLTVPGLTDHL